MEPRRWRRKEKDEREEKEQLNKKTTQNEAKTKDGGGREVKLLSTVLTSMSHKSLKSSHTILDAIAFLPSKVLYLPRSHFPLINSILKPDECRYSTLFFPHASWNFFSCPTKLGFCTSNESRPVPLSRWQLMQLAPCKFDYHLIMRYLMTSRD